jgi:6-pyruvoyl-tetrahydropterin synthase
MQLFVNDLTVMDFSYLCPERGMVGESWIVDVILNGDLNEESMVLDFGKVKKQLKYLIDEHIDHKLLVPVEHAYSVVTQDDKNDRVKVDFMRPDNKSIHLDCPDEAYAFVYAQQVTMPSVSDYLKDVIATHLPENVQGIELILRAEVINTPYYHYTHGLKKHDGNCQRIAHGHRSKVLVFENQQPSLRWQEYWAKRWSDIYIGTEEDIVEPSETNLRLNDVDFEKHFVFAYESSQGRFELAIPKAESELMQTDTTVECLAQYMVEEQVRLAPGEKYKVLAFEGVGKGAISHG